MPILNLNLERTITSPMKKILLPLLFVPVLLAPGHLRAEDEVKDIAIVVKTTKGQT